jgi:transposase
MKFTDEERRRMLEEVLVEGQKIQKVSDKYQIKYQQLYLLVQRARQNGIDSVLHQNTVKHYSAEFKLEVVRHVLDGTSQAKTAVLYNVHQSVVGLWCMKYAEKGIEGLSDTRRPKLLKEDRPEADSPKRKKRVHTEREYQELEKRLRHAEMENEFLKKLDALVLERIERERRK